jgi:hypothetical protein
LPNTTLGEAAFDNNRSRKTKMFETAQLSELEAACYFDWAGRICDSLFEQSWRLSLLGSDKKTYSLHLITQLIVTSLGCHRYALHRASMTAAVDQHRMPADTMPGALVVSDQCLVDLHISEVSFG